MQRNRSKTRRMALVGLVALILIVLLVGAYMLSQDEEPSDEQTPVTLFLGYIPNVQFAPVYVALANGYFADEGLAVTLEHSFNETDGVERIAAGDLQFGLISGEQVLLARANARPVVYVFEWYHRFPVGIAAFTASGITEPADLADRVVGLPGQYGASYIGLRALLDAADLSDGDLKELRSIGYTSVQNICEEQVDAAVVYVVNEPLLIEQQCGAVTTIEVSDYATLVSNGLVTNEATIRDNPDLVRGMVRALQRGLRATLDQPDAAFDSSVTYITDLPDDQYDTQRQVLANALELWRADELGQTDPAAWEATQAILLEVGLIDAPLADLPAAYDMQFLPR